MHVADLHLRENLAQSVVGQAIDHQPHRTVFVVLAQQHHGPRKARIVHARHGDQDVANQRFRQSVNGRVHGRIVAPADRGAYFDSTRSTPSMPCDSECTSPPWLSLIFSRTSLVLSA